MAKNSLKIVIFDGSFSTTPFINRMIAGLSVHHEVFVLGFNEKQVGPVKGVRYLPLGDNQNKFRFIWVSIGLALRTRNPFHVLTTLWDILRGKRKRIQKRNLNWQIKKVSPDIIHVQWPSLIPWVEDLLHNNRYAFLMSLRGFHINVRPFVNDGNRKYLREFLPKFRGFHGVSKAIIQELEEIVATPHSIKRVVYTGFDLDELSCKENYSRETPLHLIAVGRSHWIKGYDVLIKAMIHLKEQQVPFHLTIVGGGRDEELLFLIHNFELESYVTLTGKLSQHEVIRNISNAHLMLISSIAEGLPNVAVEAMALGIPVISTRCGGVEELVSHDKTGWLVPTYDANAFAKAIVEFSQLSDDVIQEIRVSARRKVEEQHSMKRMVDGMEALYQLVMNK